MSNESENMMDVEEVPDGDASIPAKPEKQSSEIKQPEISDEEEITEVEQKSPIDKIENEETYVENKSPELYTEKPEDLHEPDNAIETDVERTIDNESVKSPEERAITPVEDSATMKPQDNQSDISESFAEDSEEKATELKEAKSVEKDLVDANVSKAQGNFEKEDSSFKEISESEAMEVEEDKISGTADQDVAKESTGSKDVVEDENALTVDEKTESVRLQISAVTGNTESVESDSKIDGSSKTADDEGKKEDSEMETEDGGDLKMIISESHTVVSEDNDEIEKVETSDGTREKTPEETGEKTPDENKGNSPDENKGKSPDDQEKKDIEVDDSESADKSKSEPSQEEENENKEDTKDMAENVLSENDGLGIKILSVSAATDSAETKKEEVTTIEDGDKNKDEKKEQTKEEDSKEKKDDLDTVSEESPKRITRSRTGSIPAPTQPFTSPPFTSGTSKPQQPQQICIVCHRAGKCKYNIVRNGDVKHLCNDKCFKEFRSLPTKYLRSESAKIPAPPPPKTPISKASKYNTCTVCQLMDVNAVTPFLNWSSLSFCGEECLTRYKKQMKSTCGQCTKVMPPSQRATFCLKVGSEVKQFCNSECYLKFKSKKKMCIFCKKDVTGDPDAFIAPSGSNGEFLDFCSPGCMTKFEKHRDNDVEIIRVEPGKKDMTEVPCAVCMKVTKPKHELTFEGKLHKMCSDPCYSAFQYANKLTSNTCDNCGIYCYGEGSSPQFIQFEGHQKRFCCTKCVNAFRAINKKMIQCAWCGSRKSNFDMIERVDANNKYQLFCSLNCLSLYRVNLQATSNQSVTCDQCRKFVPAQYHLTMSDASVRNFCSYGCVMTFQGQFGAGSKTPQPNAKKIAPNQVNSATPTNNRPAATRAPVINSNQQLAQRSQTVTIKSNSQVPVVVSNQQTTKTISTSTQQRIIIQPPPPKQVKNKALLCKPYVQTKATSCRPTTQVKETQTDGEEEKKPIFIPIPIPIYIPTPLAMYSCPAPIPVPIPIPIPVPYFIPTTKKSADAILKHIKEIRERTPDDPFQAELLRMADAVANAEKLDADSDDDNMDESGDGSKADSKTTDAQEDMLQMALRMATEMSDPTDLETAVNPLTVLPFKADFEEVNAEEEEEEVTPRQRRTRGRRAAKRESTPVTPAGARRSKRQKVESDSENNPEPQEEPASVPAALPTAPPTAPDANFLLKYMYGVNAWKHWVVQKNAQLEKVKRQGSGRVKLFQTDLLQCVADELNYSLCLFVKEVRKPNGEEYAADSILYLCLGIQDYLFENGRIDNIFTDIYYEKFTECLNEVVQRFKPKLNTAGQLVCRIEEEHLWECKQLGAHSPYVLLNTLVYFNTKYFLLRTPNDHMKLSFSHIVKQWKKIQAGSSATTSKAGGGKCFYLKYQVPAALKTGLEKRSVALEQVENLDNPLRCPVKLYEFYLSKCPEAIKARNDIFYLVPERSCVPDSPVWYSTQPMTVEPMAKMLNRIHLVKEIQVAFMNAGLC